MALAAIIEVCSPPQKLKATCAWRCCCESNGQPPRSSPDREGICRPASARVQPKGYREVRSPCDQLHADAVRIVDEDGAAGSLHFRAGDHALDGCSGRLWREVRHGKPEVVDRLDPAGFGVRADVIAPADVKFHLRSPAIRYLGAE